MPLLSQRAVEQIHAAMGRYPDKRSALMPALHIAQGELGWISREAMEEVAALLDLAPDKVEEVTTFYTMYYTKPVGRYVLEVCKTLPCSILGADEIIDYLAERLGIQPGETTGNGLFSLFRVECLAACNRAPVLQVNHRYYQNLTRRKVDQLIAEARQGELQTARGPVFSIRRNWSESIEEQG